MNLYRRLRTKGWRNWRLPRSYVGMLLAHFGVAVFIVGVTLVLGYETEKDVRVAPGDRVAIAGYTLQFMGTQAVTGSTYTARRGTFAVFEDGQKVATLEPAKRFYTVSGRRTTEAAIDYSLTGDLYVSLGDPLGGGAWVARVYHKPFVEWIWAGCVIMALGGFTALSDKRYRIRASARKRKGSGREPTGPLQAHEAGHDQ